MIDKKPIFTFLETSAIDPMYNNINKIYIDLLKKHIDQNKIALTTSPIVINEIHSHMKKEIPKKYENLQGILESRELVFLKDKKKYEGLMKYYNVDEMIRDSFLTFINILKYLEVEILQDNRISITKLMNMYFQSTPPFGEKNKKSEFPDAIMYLTLQKYLGDGVKIHIIASDNDWQSIHDNDNNFIIHKSIKDYLDYLNQDDRLYNLVKMYLKSKNAKDEIINYIMKYVNNLDFTVKGYDNSIHGMKIDYDYEYVEKLSTYAFDYNIDTFEDISFINGKYIAQVVIIGCSKVDMKCYCLDEENSIWDSENHEYISKEYNEIIETHELLIPIRIFIECLDDNNYKVTDYQLIEVDYNISELNNQTRLNRQYSRYFEKDKFRVLRDFKCPSCNNYIHIDLMDGETRCICSNERKMGIENEYDIDIIDICKNCGNTFHITGKLWEYPENSFNYEKDIKITKYEA